MKLFSCVFVVVLSALVAVTVAAPQGGYQYSKSVDEGPAPVIEHGNLNGFKPVSGNGVPCAHTSHGDSSAAAAFIHQQSTGRIINHAHNNINHHEHSVESAVSGTSNSAQTVTVNGHIAVAPTEGHYHAVGPNHLQPLPSPHPPPQFAPENIPFGHVVPSQIASGQHQGYLYGRPGAQQKVQHVSSGHHQAQFNVGAAAFINGIGNAPPVQSLHHFASNSHQAAGISGNKFEASQASYNGARLPIRGGPGPFSGPAVHRPIGGPVGVRPLPVQHFGQLNSGSYAGSLGHNSNAHQVSSSGILQGSSSSSSFLNGGGFVSATGHDILNTQIGNVIRETFSNAPLDPAIEKHIYVHVPPEDLEEKTHQQAITLPQAPPKKHYKIIFIKAPSVAQPNYAQLAAAAQQQSEEKTLVYVLVKKPDEPSIQEIQQLQQAIIKPSKPEVYFIKYKTRKEGEGAGISQGPVIANSATESQFLGNIGNQFIGNSGSQFNAGGQQFNAGGQQQFNIDGQQHTFGGGVFNGDAAVHSGTGYASAAGANVGSEANEGIDIRLGSIGGESSLVSSSSNSFATSSSSSASSSSSSLNLGESNAPNNSLYGVPLN